MTKVVRIDDLSRKKKKKHKFPIKGTTIFIICMLLYPVAHFLLMWLAVNINSILLTFQFRNRGSSTLVYLGWDDLFLNYKNLFQSFKLDTYKSMFGASLAYFVVSCFVTLPLSLFFSYFIFKKILASGFFKTIFYLPSIIPLVILTLVYSLSFSPQSGFMTPLLKIFGINTAGLFIGGNAKWMVWIFCVWAGVGYNVILLTAGMSRIPRDILESCKMDGVPPMKEFIRIVIPLSWSTISTLFILGMMSVFNVYLQPMFLTSGQYDTMTIGLQIYQASGGTALNQPATLGLFCSLVGAPIICLTRWGLNKLFGEVNY